MRQFLLIIFPLFFVVQAKSIITVQCENKEYAGAKLDFYCFADPVTSEKNFVFELNFDENGKCSAFVNLPSTNYVFCDFGIYRGMLILEPNQTIKLNLPPLREKKFADEKNPYFIPISFWLTTDNRNQVNNHISDFTLHVNQLTDKYFNQLYFRQSRQMYDSVVFSVNQTFGNIRSESFLFHKKMKLKMLESDIFRMKPENYSEIFQGIKTEFWLRPSFIELFEKSFNGHLSFEAKSIKGTEIRAAVNRSDISFLLNHVKTKFNISGEVAQLALLKMLNDAFFTNDFSNSSIQKMLNDAVFTKNKNELIKTTAQNILEKITHLQAGNPAPAICLKSLDGKNICTDSNKSKFKYFVFADTEMVICREQLKHLAAINNRFEKHLEIFVVLRNTNISETKKFLSDFKIEGVQLLDEENKYIAEYKVKSFPQCFLLDENHTVEFVITKSPLDGFEQQFGTFLQRELFERQRNQSR